MIVFTVKVYELTGGVAIDVETPAAQATDNEIEVGLFIKKLLQEYEIPGRETFTTQKWGSKPTEQ